MEKKLPPDPWNLEVLASGPTNNILEMLRLAKTYHLTEHLQEMEKYASEFNNNKPIRKSLIISDPLHFDELDFLRFRIGKLYKPRDFSYMKRGFGLQTTLSFSLEYNIGIPQVEESMDKATIFHNSSDELLVVSYPQGFFVLHESNKGGNFLTTIEGEISKDEIAINPEMLEDAMWEAFFKHPPLSG